MQLSLPVDDEGPPRAAPETGLTDHAVPGKAGIAVQLQIADAGCGPFAVESFIIHGAGIDTGGAECAAGVTKVEPGYTGQGVFSRMHAENARFAGGYTGVCTARAAGFQWQPVMPGWRRAQRLLALCLL